MMSLGPRSLRQAVFTRLPMIFAESLEKCPKSIGSKETAKPVLTRKQDTMPLASLMVGRSRASYDAIPHFQIKLAAVIRTEPVAGCPMPMFKAFDLGCLFGLPNQTTGLHRGGTLWREVD